MWRKPILIINNSGGKNILPGLSGLWISCKVIEQAGGESDSSEIVCGGDPEEGDTITIHLRTADYVDKLKAHASKHYDDKTYGDIIKDIAKQVGLEAEVDQAVGKIKVPYLLRWNQSHIDFATEFSEGVGAICKPAGGKLIAVKRCGGKSASGKSLTPIEIIRRKGFAYEVEIEPCPELGNVAASTTKRSAGARSPSTRPGAPVRSTPCRTPSAASFGRPIDGRWKAESVEKIWDANDGFVTTVHVKAGDDEKGKKG